ncbi:hypothetical protein [Acinetobacter lwoffii]
MTEQEKNEQFGVLPGSCPCCQESEYNVNETVDEQVTTEEES